MGEESQCLFKLSRSGHVTRTIPSFFCFEGYYEHSKVIRYDMQQWSTTQICTVDGGSAGIRIKIYPIWIFPVCYLTMLFCWGKKGLLGLWLKGEKSEHPCFYGVLPVDAHISLSPKGLEAGQKADRRISVCASILGTPESFQRGYPFWPFRRENPADILPEPIQPAWQLKKGESEVLCGFCW